MARKRTERDTNRIVLPSGRTVEVAQPAPSDLHAAPRPSDDAPAPAEHGTERDPNHRPQLCPVCASTLVYPLAWRAVDRRSWEVDLRCPNCQLERVGVLSQEVAERFDEELEQGNETLIDDLTRLAEANLAEDLERFAAALEADAIMPMDF